MVDNWNDQTLDNALDEIEEWFISIKDIKLLKAHNKLNKSKHNTDIDISIAEDFVSRKKNLENEIENNSVANTTKLNKIHSDQSQMKIKSEEFVFSYFTL